ncbi:MAG: protein kinase, partial [Pirellulaceae bacterium]
MNTEVLVSAVDQVAGAPLLGPTLPAPAQDAAAQPGNRAGAPREILPGYRMIQPIGAGGYGEVWRVEAPGGLAKAAKIVYGLADEKRAADESKALLRIRDVRHPFLLSLERIEIVNRQLVVISELADSSLKDRFDKCLAAGKPGIPRDELLGYMAETADALDFMTSEHGLQHLDIKPENLLLVGGHIKVADFGLVKSVHDASVSIVAGLTPMFAAPETFDGRPSDRSDQYSLAIVYQLLLTG